MSNKIGGGGAGNQPGVQQGDLPWPDDAGVRVRQLRRAITAQMNGEMVDTDVAPLMNELLMRLDTLVGRAEQVDLPSPDFPDPVNPPTPQEASALLNRAAAEARRAVSEVGGDAAGRIKRMVDVLDGHLQMKREAVARAEGGNS